MNHTNWGLAMEQLKTVQKNEVKLVNFESLVYDLNILDVRLLKLFYVPKSTCWTLDNVVKRIKQKGMDVSKETVRRYVFKLDKKGLLKAVKKSKPLAIQSNNKIEEDVNKLIILSSARLMP